eukprot:scaffold973_cov106-Isochrysis_galbana.AAC.1
MLASFTGSSFSSKMRRACVNLPVSGFLSAGLMMIAATAAAAGSVPATGEDSYTMSPKRKVCSPCRST